MINFTMRNHGYDFIVIGAGPAGLMWAHRALESGKSVLLIDQGEFRAPTYSSIGIGLEPRSDFKVGGIGGTANAWQGQCIQLTEAQFKSIFPKSTKSDFMEYINESRKVADFLKIKFDHRSLRLGMRIRKELGLKENIVIRQSCIPLEQNWKKIFSWALSNPLLSCLEERVDRIESTDSRITSIVFENGKEFSVSEKTDVVLAVNSIETAILSAKMNGNTQLSEKSIKVFDHPWRTQMRFKSGRNKFARRKIFSYHFGFGYRMKSKHKFEVMQGDSAIGVFELRPIYKGSVLKKSIARLSQLLIGFSIIKPTYVDVWSQIVQSESISYASSSQIESSLSIHDLHKLEKLEEEVKDVLLGAGFKFLLDLPSSPIEQAFHTTGTLTLGSKQDGLDLKFPGISNSINGFYVSGGSFLGNCSWANPTFTILVLSSLLAKKITQRTFEI